MSRKIHLKIKIKTLAAEGKFIRKEENKAKASFRWLAGRAQSRAVEAEIAFNVLYNHRTDKVRKAARHSILAYGYIRGRAYRKLEEKCNEPPNWAEVYKIVKRFGGSQDPEAFRLWYTVSPVQLSEVIELEPMEAAAK
jgi:hypothetical protein